MSAELIDFHKDEAAQALLGFAGLTEPYESVISSTALKILRKNVPECEIESIRFVRSAGSHPKMQAGGMPTDEGTSHFWLEEITLPFDLEMVVVSGSNRQRLAVTFTFECTHMDAEPVREHHLEIHGQEDA